MHCLHEVANPCHIDKSIISGFQASLMTVQRLHSLSRPFCQICYLKVCYLRAQITEDGTRGILSFHVFGRNNFYLVRAMLYKLFT